MDGATRINRSQESKSELKVKQMELEVEKLQSIMEMQKNAQGLLMEQSILQAKDT